MNDCAVLELSCCTVCWQITQWLQGLFQFSVVWSIGSTVTGTSRKGFDKFFRSLINGLNTDHPKPKSCKITKVPNLSLLNITLCYFSQWKEEDNITYDKLKMLVQDRLTFILVLLN